MSAATSFSCVGMTHSRTSALPPRITAPTRDSESMEGDQLCKREV